MAAFPAGEALQAQNICRHLIFPLQFVPVGRGPAVLLELGPQMSSAPLPAASVPNYSLLRKTHLHLRTVLLFLRLKSIVYIATHLKTGTRSKMNTNPASSAASE